MLVLICGRWKKATLNGGLSRHFSLQGHEEAPKAMACPLERSKQDVLAERSMCRRFSTVWQATGYITVGSFDCLFQKSAHMHMWMRCWECKMVSRSSLNRRLSFCRQNLIFFSLICIYCGILRLEDRPALIKRHNHKSSHCFRPNFKLRRRHDPQPLSPDPKQHHLLPRLQ